MASGFGRGGRGAAILELLQKQSRPPGEEPPDEPVTSTPKPVGRGSLMQTLLAQKAAASAASSASGDAPVPAGRAGLLAKLAAHQNGAPKGRGALLATQPTAGTTPSPPPQQQQTDPQNAVPQSDDDYSLAKKFDRLSIQKTKVENHGTAGDKVSLATNSLWLKCKSKGMYQYSVHFFPNIDSKEMRYILLYDQHNDDLPPPRQFDGTTLVLKNKLPSDEITWTSTRPTDDMKVTLKIKLTNVRPMSVCIPQLNGIFRKIMRHLKMVDVIGRYYDPHRPANIPQHRLEVWPGYITTVEEQEGGLMLLCDVTHKVLRTETVLDKMTDLFRNPGRGGDFKAECFKAIVGESVLTRYNNKNYRIDDIAWDIKPTSTFTNQDGKEISFQEYYKTAYNKEITDLNQPMLVHVPKKKDIQRQRKGRPTLERILLVPEFAFLTGLSDTMRADFRVTKDLATHTRITPAQRHLAIRKFTENVHSHPEAVKELDKWDMTLSSDIVTFDGRCIRPLDIVFGKGRTVTAGEEADWGRQLGRCPVITAVDINNWILVFPNQDRAVANEFVQVMMQEAPKMGIRVQAPVRGGMVLANVRNESYITQLRSAILPETQLVVCLMPRGRDDLYSAVKTLCCHEMPVPSQMIVNRTISDRKKQRSVVQKVILQINAKLGGELWAVRMPTMNLMVCGIDVYHDKSSGKSVAALVCSTNSHCTRWYSRTCEQMKGQELVDCLAPCFIAGIRKFAECNQTPPSRIVLFRDGVGDGQLSYVSQHEASQLVECFSHFSSDYKPKLSIVVVQKRINQRIFGIEGRSLKNPAPGTVVDHTITRFNWYDFFLVSQHVRQGTVSPTHYVVVHDDSGWDCDRMQRLSYMMTHLYYNWPGTVRVPAPCQYAHKLASLQGQNLKKPFDQALANRLFYL